MIPYTTEPNRVVKLENGKLVNDFYLESINIDLKTVESFGEEWEKFNSFSDEEIKNAGDQYFDIVDNKIINKNSVVLDLGCGSGRWTKYISDKVKFVEAVDPSKAIYYAANRYSS